MLWCMRTVLLGLLFFRRIHIDVTILLVLCYVDWNHELWIWMQLVSSEAGIHIEAYNVADGNFIIDYPNEYIWMEL